MDSTIEKKYLPEFSVSLAWQFPWYCRDFPSWPSCSRQAAEGRGLKYTLTTPSWPDTNQLRPLMHIHSVLCCQIYFRNINFKNECCEGNPVDPVLLHDESQNSIYSQPDKPARTSLTEDARKIRQKEKKYSNKWNLHGLRSFFFPNSLNFREEKSEMYFGFFFSWASWLG